MVADYGGKSLSKEIDMIRALTKRVMRGRVGKSALVYH
jgi:hypothetical protein